MATSEPICIVCNKPGRHFVPPSMGRLGYHRCEPASGAPASSRGRSRKA